MSKLGKLSATGKLMEQLSIVMSEYYSNAISEATKRGMLHRVTNGYAVSRPPLGYSTTETPGLFKINHQGLFLRKYLKLLVNGKAAIKYIRFDLMFMFRDHDEQLKLWSIARIKRFLSDPYYIGYVNHKGQLYSGLHEPLITEDEQKKLLALLGSQSDDNSLKPVDKSLQKH